MHARYERFDRAGCGPARQAGMTEDRAAVTARHHAVLEPPRHLRQLVSASLGPSGEAVAVWSDLAGQASLATSDQDERNLAVRPMHGPRASMAINVISRDEIAFVMVEQSGADPIAQPLTDGLVLLVSRWAEWRPDTGADRNATIFSPAGEVESSACLGDGIEHVVATTGNSVWVGYSDMGVFGNNGWGQWGGPQPIGAAGIAHFSPNLKMRWEFPGGTSSINRHDKSRIHHCEALAIANEDVWAYHEPTLSVSRISAEAVTTWPPGQALTSCPMGIQAIATDGQRVALAGGYAGHEGRIVIGRLEDRWILEQELTLTLPDGSAVPPSATIRGLGDTLHVFAEHQWYVVDLEELGRL